MICATSVSGLWIRRHLCFANIILLKHNNSPNPKPPKDFELQIFNQLIHAIFVSFSLDAHQNRNIGELISRYKALDSWNTLILYVGIAWITALIIISLIFSYLYEEFFLNSYPLIHSLMLLNLLVFDFPTIACSLKYFSIITLRCRNTRMINNIQYIPFLLVLSRCYLY
jgi:hypothetical protein